MPNCPLALHLAFVRPASWAPLASMLAGGRGSIPRGGAAADHLSEGSRRREAPLVGSIQRPRNGEQPPAPCSICIAFASCPRVPPAPASSPPVIQPLSLCPLAPVRRRFDESQLFASRDGASPTPAQPQPRSPSHRPEPTCTAAARLSQRLRTPTRILRPLLPPSRDLARVCSQARLWARR